MNVYAEEEVAIIVTYKNLLQYESVSELFRSLYNFCKMLKARQHMDYCYCNCVPEQCHLCKFSDFIIHYNIQDSLIYYREKEERLLEIVNRFHFYIKKIKTEMKRYPIGYDVLAFIKHEYEWKFGHVVMKLDEVIRNDIEIFEQNQRENYNNPQ